MKRSVCFALWLAALAPWVIGCGGKHAQVSGTASFFNGATPVPGSSLIGSVGQAVSSLSDGNWLLSPDKMQLTLESIGLMSDSGNGSGGGTGTSFNFPNCVVTYDRSQVGLSKLVDCPFTLDAGTYQRIYVGFNATYKVLINDSANGIYSDPSSATKLKTGTAPSGGAQFITVTTNSSGSTFGASGALAQPLTIKQGDALTLNVVINGLQFFKATVSSGNAVVGHYGMGDPFRPDAAISLGSVAKIGYYVQAGIGTALSYNTNTAGAIGIGSVSVYYSAPTTPAALFLGFNGNPPGCNTPPPGPNAVGGVINSPPTPGSGLGGYLGLDSTGLLGWALPTDNTWTAYATEFSMQQQTTLNATTTLKCKNISTDPAPAGGTFASGAPNIASPNYQVNLTLVAK